jgi:hypothetical protein
MNLYKNNYEYKIIFITMGAIFSLSQSFAPLDNNTEATARTVSEEKTTETEPSDEADIEEGEETPQPIPHSSS